MEQRFRTTGAADGGVGTLEPAGERWSAGVFRWAGAGEPFLVLALPEPETEAGPCDTERLAASWGFTRCGTDGQLLEIGEAPAVTVRLGPPGSRWSSRGSPG